MKDISGKGIFFAELDDDFQDIQGLTEPELWRRAACYFLLAPVLIVHPAYIWQSRMTHDLVRGPAADLLTPPFAQLELGNHEDIRDYMTQRMEALRKPSSGTRELRQYESHGPRLVEEAQLLDRKFREAFSRPVSSDWRDRKFRDLLYADLGATDLDRVSLATQLGAFRLNPQDAERGREFAERMQRFVRTSGLVSMDTFRNRIITYGFNDLESSPDLRRRLLALYYETYTDERTIIPATSKLLFGQVVNPYDTDVFWRIICNIFGSTCVNLTQLDKPEIVKALREIKASADWPNFASIYFSTLQTVDETLWDQPDKVIRAFDRHKPERSSLFILKRLWQRRKLDLSAAAFGAVALSTAASFASGEAVAAAVAGFASTGFGAVSLLRGVRKFVAEYAKSDIVRVKETIRREVTRALKDIRSNDPYIDY